MGFARQKFFARYGDHLQKDLANFRRESKDEKLEGWDILSKENQWTLIITNLQDEKWQFDAAKYEDRPRNKPFTYALTSVIRGLNLDAELMRRKIYPYAERNDLFHDDTDSFLETGNWPGLALALHEDLIALPFLISPQRAQLLNDFQAELEGIRDFYFIYLPENVGKPTS